MQTRSVALGRLALAWGDLAPGEPNNWGRYRLIAAAAPGSGFAIGSRSDWRRLSRHGIHSIPRTDDGRRHAPCLMPGGKWLTFHSPLGLGPAAASSPIDSSQLGPKLKGVRIVDLGTPPLKLQ